MSSFQLKLAEIMEKKGLNATELERKTGISRNTIHNFMTGAATNPTTNTLRSISEALGVKFEFMLVENNNELDVNTLTNQQMKVLEEATTATINIVIEKNMSFSFEKLSELIKEVFLYAIKVNPPVVEERFIQWMIEKHNSNN